MINEYKIAVIGAGAAGMMASIAAGVYFSQGEVVLFEAKERPGRKIVASGNGRCNFSHRSISPLQYHGKEMVREIFALHSPDDSLKCFEKWGLLYVEEEGRLYPFSGTSSSILDLLLQEMNRLKVQMLCSTPIEKIEKMGRYFVLTSKAGIQYRAAKIILTTGGKASPQLGYEGGYALAKELDLPCTPLTPGLVGMTCTHSVRKKKGLQHLDGLRIKARITWKPFEQGREKEAHPLIISDHGEVLFRSYGLSGIVIFQMSRYAGPGILSLDLFENMNRTELANLFLERKKSFPERRIADFFVGIFHSKIARALLKECRFEGDDLEQSVSELSIAAIEQMVEVLKDWSFPIEGVTGWEHAQVTLGGLKCNAFSSKDLQSIIHKGLYAAGEILDVDGPCGGYNLQWAWSSGWVAGCRAALSLKEADARRRRSHD